MLEGCALVQQLVPGRHPHVRYVFPKHYVFILKHSYHPAGLNMDKTVRDLTTGDENLTGNLQINDNIHDYVHGYVHDYIQKKVYYFWKIILLNGHWS